MKERNGDRNQLFLFVNKDSSSKSLSKSEGASAKQINRHAQQVRNRRLALQKASTARHSSSSARRIALGGWVRREGEIAISHESEVSRSQAGVDFYNVLPSSDQGITTVTAGPSRDNPSPSSSSPDDTPERRESDSDRRNSQGSSPREGSQDGPGAADCPITSTAPRDTLSPTNGVDPIGLLPVRINEKIYAALQFSLQIYPYSGNNYKLAYLPHHTKPTMNQFPIKEVIHQSVYQEHHLYSLLAAISIQVKNILGRDMQSGSPALYRAQAARHLSDELSRGAHTTNIDKHSILDILFLCVSDMAHKDYESALKHLTVVGSLYPVLDTDQHFDFWISETAAHVDNQLALSTGRRPILPCSFDPGPLLPERMAALKRELKMISDREIANSYLLPSPRALAVSNAPRGLKDAVADLAASLDLRMGSKFEWGLKVGVYSAKMSRVIQDLVDCVAIAKVVWLSPHAVCFDAEWLCRKARAVMRSLLALAPENMIGPLDLLGKCMEGARISLLIMMSHACTVIGFQTAKANVTRLRNAMSFALQFWCPTVGLNDECSLIDGAQMDPFSEIQLGFILFALMVGVWSAIIAETPIIERWFSVRCVNICHIIGIRNYFDLREHLVSFLHSKTLQDATVRKVASYLEQGQSRDGLAP